jgi:nicotinamidase/pyrazinamidase
MRALLLLDIQNDFCPGGALPAVDGNRIVAVANRLIPHFDLVLATLDFHPPNHGSFASQHPNKRPFDMGNLSGRPQLLWPTHCVQGTHGAEFHPCLHVAAIEQVFAKGTNPKIDSYSGFFDNGRRKSTGLCDCLRAHGVDHVVVMGLPTEFCVRATVLDALDLGLQVTVVADGCRPLDLMDGDGERALESMRMAGAAIVESRAIVQPGP